MRRWLVNKLLDLAAWVHIYGRGPEYGRYYNPEVAEAMEAFRPQNDKTYVDWVVPRCV
jgi:hypothetical protein